MRLFALPFVAGLGGLVAGCASLPPPGATRALYVDLDQIAAGRERTEWVVDEVEVAAAADDLMRSVCPVPAEARQALKGWLVAREAEEGGSAEALWKANGGELSGAAGRALHLERVGLLLAHGDKRAGECPFWLAPDPEFAGVHADAGRFVLHAETMGAFQLVFSDAADPAVGGAGLGRLLAGVGLNHRFTLLVGLEAGLASELDRGKDGAVRVTPGFAAGVPVVLRVHAGSLRFDTGVSLTGRSADPDFSNPRMGVRYDQAVGVAALRTAGVQPYVMLWAGHEWLPESDGRPGLNALRVGSRVGISWDP